MQFLSTRGVSIISIPEFNAQGKLQVTPDIFYPWFKKFVNGHDISLIRTWKQTLDNPEYRLYYISFSDAIKIFLSEMNSSSYELNVSQSQLTEFNNPYWNSGFIGDEFPQTALELSFDTMESIEIVHPNSALIASGSFGLDNIVTIMLSHMKASAEYAKSLSRAGLTKNEVFAVRLISYRSHSEGFLVSQPNKEEIRKHFDQFYLRVKDLLFEKIYLISSDNVKYLPNDEQQINQKWTSFYGKWHDVLVRLITQKRIYPKSVDKLPISGPLFLSKFHTAIPYSKELQYYLNKYPEFLATRLLTSTLYSSIYSAGCPLFERYLTCYLIAKASEEYFNIPWKTQLDMLNDTAKLIYNENQQ